MSVANTRTLGGSFSPSIGPAVQKALGLQVGGGRGSDISRYREAERDIELAMAVRPLLDKQIGDEGWMSQEAAFAHVAETCGMSVEVVRRAWRLHGEKRPATFK